MEGEVPLRFSEDRVIVEEALALQRLIILVMNGRKYPIEGREGVSLAEALTEVISNDIEFVKDLAQLATQHATDVINSVDSETRDLIQDIKVRVRPGVAPDESFIEFTMFTARGTETTVKLPIIPEKL